MNGYVVLAIEMAAIIGSFYVFLIMPQRRREKKMKEMLAAVQVGNEIVTQGGIIGRIINIKDNDVTIETGVLKTQIKIRRSAIQEVKKVVEA